MQAHAGSQPPLSPHAHRIAPAILAIAMAILFGPTLMDLVRSVWSTDEQGHGPIVLAVSVWLLVRNWGQMLAQRNPPTPWGWPVLGLGLLCYLLGRSQEILLFEVGSLLPIACGIGFLTVGTRGTRQQWFALFFAAFMIPLPGIVVETLTMPMKMAVSYVAEHVLYGLGFPISRSGVVLQIDQYQLLVADACAGLHTLFTLEALGLLYMNIVRRTSPARNILLATLIVPISFTANTIRVMTLTLITFYFGDEAGQGFLHGFAGMVLFASALGLTIMLDTVLHLIFDVRKTSKPTGAAA